MSMLFGRRPTWCPGRYWQVGSCELDVRKDPPTEFLLLGYGWHVSRPSAYRPRWFSRLPARWNAANPDGRSFLLRVPLGRSWELVFMWSRPG